MFALNLIDNFRCCVPGVGKRAIVGFVGEKYHVTRSAEQGDIPETDTLLRQEHYLGKSLIIGMLV